MKDSVEKFKQYIEQFDEDFDRVHAIMDLAQKQPPFGSQPSTAAKVPGCQSTLWVWGQKTVCGHWHFHSTSDGLFTAGMAQLALGAVNGHTSQELETLDIHWFDQLDLPGLMTGGRMNGFQNLLKVVNGIVNQG